MYLKLSACFMYKVGITKKTDVLTDRYGFVNNTSYIVKRYFLLIIKLSKVYFTHFSYKTNIAIS